MIPHSFQFFFSLFVIFLLPWFGVVSSIYLYYQPSMT